MHSDSTGNTRDIGGDDLFYLDDEDEFLAINGIAREEGSKSFIELRPLKVGWYNDLMNGPEMKVPLSYNTLAFAMVNQPEMLELLRVRMKEDKSWLSSCNPIDDISRQIVKETVDRVSEHFCQRLGSGLNQIRILHDEDVNPLTLYPTVHCQTAGHVAGSAYYYQCKDSTETENILNCSNFSCTKEEFDERERREHFRTSSLNKAFVGVSLHPVFGGWFSFSGMVCFPQIVVDRNNHFFHQQPPLDVLEQSHHRLLLLHLFKCHAFDHRFRNLSRPMKTYSSEWEKVFSTPFNNRKAEIIKLVNPKSHQD